MVWGMAAFMLSLYSLVAAAVGATATTRPSRVSRSPWVGDLPHPNLVVPMSREFRGARSSGPVRLSPQVGVGGIRGGAVNVRASAVQHSDGRKNTGIHHAKVRLSMPGMPSMGVVTARRLAAAIIEAADLCDRWATDSR